MKKTQHYNLNKPLSEEFYDIEQQNENMDLIDEALKDTMDKAGNPAEAIAQFEKATVRENIQSGEKISTIFGKVGKYFTDLKSVAFSGSYHDLSDKPSIPTVPGAIKNPHSLSVNGKSYDGAAAVEAGTIGVAYGGTGATTAAAARSSLGAAAASHNHSTDDITSGALPVARGGTGATTAAAARTALGLGAVATQGVANNLTTTAEGYALDARQGKVLKDEVDEINSNIEQVNQNLGGLSFYEDENGNKWVRGADSVPKKLGSCPPITFRIPVDGGSKEYRTHSSFNADITEYNVLDANYNATYIYSIGRVEGITSDGATTRLMNAETTYNKSVKNIDISKYVTLRFSCSTAYEGKANLQAVIYSQ